jgi:hypothetical protein
VAIKEELLRSICVLRRVLEGTRCLPVCLSRGSVIFLACTATIVLSTARKTQNYNKQQHLEEDRLALR